jgi:hypothetical protein
MVGHVDEGYRVLLRLNADSVLRLSIMIYSCLLDQRSKICDSIVWASVPGGCMGIGES